MNKCMKKTLFFLFLLCSCTIFSQKSDKMLKVDAMHEDLDYFYATLLETHPYPYLIISQDTWKQTIDSLKTSITTPLTIKEFLIKISVLNKYLDAHSKIAGPKKILKKMKAPLDLPFFEEDDNQRVFVMDAKSGDTIELLSVDNKPLEEIRSFCKDRYSLVEPMKDANFLNYMRWYCNTNLITDSVCYTYKDKNGNTLLAHFKRNKEKKDIKSLRQYNLICDSINSVALMEINTFMPKLIRMGKYKKDVGKYFNELKDKNINTLFIDVSCNSGGSVALVNWLASFFIKESSIYVGTDTQKFSKHRNKQKLDWLVYNNREGFVQKKSYWNTTSSEPKFFGNVYVIQSRDSFSGASVFASLMQYYVKNCKIIGEEGEVKAFYADPLIFTMPNSKLRFSLSSMYGRFVGKDKQKGVVPDIHYNIYDSQKIFSIEDVMNMTER